MAINDGEIVAILGDKESGKTTLLKTIGNCFDFDGDVLLNGKSIKGQEEDVIFVFDDLALFDNKTFYYNLAYPLVIRGFDKTTIDNKVQKVAEMFGIVACLKDKVKNSSELDKRRLAISRIFLRDAKLVLIDEISLGLSSDESKILWDEIMPKLVDLSKQGVTIIYSTEQKEEAISISNRIAVLNYGDLKDFGTYEEIVANPKNIWAIEKLVNNYHFEKAQIVSNNESTELLFDNTYALNINFLKGKIINEYLNAIVYVGWKQTEYLDDGDRKQKVLYSVKTNCGYVNYTENEFKVFTKNKKDFVSTLPQIEKVKLFDYNNENNILL